MNLIWPRDRERPACRHKNFLYPCISFLPGLAFLIDVTIPVRHDFGFPLHRHPHFKVILSRPRPLFICSFVASSSMLNEDTLLGSVFLLCRNSTMTVSEVIRVWGTLWKANLLSTKTQPVSLTYLLLWNSRPFIKWQVIDFLQYLTQACPFIFSQIYLPSPACIPICGWFGNSVLMECPITFTFPSGCWPPWSSMVQCFTGQEVLQFHCLSHNISFQLPAILEKRKFHSGWGLQFPAESWFSEPDFDPSASWSSFRQHARIGPKKQALNPTYHIPSCPAGLVCPSFTHRPEPPRMWRGREGERRMERGFWGPFWRLLPS